jgi:hypothetical protein
VLVSERATLVQRCAEKRRIVVASWDERQEEVGMWKKKDNEIAEEQIIAKIVAVEGRKEHVHPLWC